MLLVLHNNLAAGGGPTNYVLTTDVGTYSVTGNSAALSSSRLLETTIGSYTVTGFSANLIYTAANSFLLETLPGSYTVTGNSANLLYSSILTTNPDSYTITGFSANLDVASPNKLLTTEVGQYVINGFSASLSYSGEENILKPGGRGLSPWQLRQQRLEALKNELWYLYQDENDEEVKEALLEVVRDDKPNEEDLDTLLSVLRKQLTFVKSLYDKAQQEQYQKAFEAAEEIKKQTVKKKRDEEAIMLLF